MGSVAESRIGLGDTRVTLESAMHFSQRSPGCCSGLGRYSGDAFCDSSKVWGFPANLHEH